MVKVASVYKDQICERPAGLCKGIDVQEYATAQDMMESTCIKVGYAHTLGFYEVGDGGAAYYTVGGEGEPNGMDVLECRKGLVAELNQPVNVNVSLAVLGAKAGSDCSAVVNYALANYNGVDIPFDIVVDNEIYIPKKTDFNGMGHKITSNSTGNAIRVFIESATTQEEGDFGYIHDFYLECEKCSVGIYNQYAYKGTYKNIQILNFNNVGIYHEHGYEVLYSRIRVVGASNETVGFKLYDSDYVLDDIQGYNVHKCFEINGGTINILNAHVWIGAREYFENSTFAEINTSAQMFFTDCYVDTYQNSFEINTMPVLDICGYNSWIAPQNMPENFMGNSYVFKVNGNISTNRISLLNAVINGMSDHTANSYFCNSEFLGKAIVNSYAYINDVPFKYNATPLDIVLGNGVELLSGGVYNGYNIDVQVRLKKHIENSTAGESFIAFTLPNDLAVNNVYGYGISSTSEYRAENASMFIAYFNGDSNTLSITPDNTISNTDAYFYLTMTLNRSSVGGHY